MTFLDMHAVLIQETAYFIVWITDYVPIHELVRAAVLTRGEVSFVAK